MRRAQRGIRLRSTRPWSSNISSNKCNRDRTSSRKCNRGRHRRRKRNQDKLRRRRRNKDNLSRRLCNKDNPLRSHRRVGNLTRKISRRTVNTGSLAPHFHGTTLVVPCFFWEIIPRASRSCSRLILGRGRAQRCCAPTTLGGTMQSDVNSHRLSRFTCEIKCHAVPPVRN
jgi:hypothetical protein